MMSRDVQNVFVLWGGNGKDYMLFAVISSMARNLQAIKYEQANLLRHQNMPKF